MTNLIKNAEKSNENGSLLFNFDFSYESVIRLNRSLDTLITLSHEKWEDSGLDNDDIAKLLDFKEVLSMMVSEYALDPIEGKRPIILVTNEKNHFNK